MILLLIISLLVALMTGIALIAVASKAEKFLLALVRGAPKLTVSTLTGVTIAALFAAICLWVGSLVSQVAVSSFTLVVLASIFAIAITNLNTRRPMPTLLQSLSQRFALMLSGWTHLVERRQHDLGFSIANVGRTTLRLTGGGISHSRHLARPSSVTR